MNATRVFNDASFIHELSFHCEKADQCALAQVSTVTWNVLGRRVGRCVRGVSRVLSELYGISFPSLNVEGESTEVYLPPHVSDDRLRSFRNDYARHVVMLDYYAHRFRWHRLTGGRWTDVSGSPLLPNLMTLIFRRSDYRIHNVDGELDNDPLIPDAIRALTGPRLRRLFFDGPTNGSRACLSLTQAVNVLDAIHHAARLTHLELLAHRAKHDETGGRTPERAIAAICSRFIASSSLAHLSTLSLCATSISYDMLLAVGRLSALVSFTIVFPYCARSAFRNFVPHQLHRHTRSTYFRSLKCLRLEDVPATALLRLLASDAPCFSSPSIHILTRATASHHRFDALFPALAAHAFGTLEDFTFMFSPVAQDEALRCCQISTASLVSLASLPLKRLRLENVKLKGCNDLSPLRGFFDDLVELRWPEQHISMEDIMTIARERKHLRVLAVTLPILSPSLELPVWNGERSPTRIVCEANFRFQGATQEWVRLFARWLLSMFSHFEPRMADDVETETLGDVESIVALQYMVIFLSYTTNVPLSVSSLISAR